MSKEQINDFLCEYFTIAIHGTGLLTFGAGYLFGFLGSFFVFIGFLLDVNPEFHWSMLIWVHHWVGAIVLLRDDNVERK